ncbi:MCE family protein [Nocardia sp. CA-120079]|uniref:MCE family protein n=1 Tax=Nocardia sp. CA-120079 TaxID=3239974 RepID=UPI003D96C9F3
MTMIDILRRVTITRRTALRIGAVIAVCAVALVGARVYQCLTRTTVVAYFSNTNGLYQGDNVLLLGLKIGTVDEIRTDGDKMRVTFHYKSSVKIPATAKAVILSPTLVSARAIQLTPAYERGPELSDHAVIPIDRTAVPVEWDDFRKQLDRLASSLGPTPSEPNGPLGSFINSGAEALDGNGARLHRTITQLSDALTTVSNGRHDLFSIVRNLQVFVSALAASSQQIVEINGHLASVSGLLTGTDHDLSDALVQLDGVANDLKTFIGENRDGVQHAADALTTLTTTLNQSKPAIENLLHVAPNAFGNFNNIYNPAQGALTGALAVTQMQNPLQFICGAVQAASRLGAAEAAKLCVQYLGPVLQSLKFNYPPVGVNMADGVDARPDQVDYSEPALNPYPDGPPPSGAVVAPGTGLAGLLPGGHR